MGYRIHKTHIYIDENTQKRRYQSVTYTLDASFGYACDATGIPWQEFKMKLEKR
jgi:hypothetical protein